jgi:hypothetical protein
VARFRSRPAVTEADQWWPGKDVPGVHPGLEGEYGPYVVTVHGQRAFLAPGDYVVKEPVGDGYYPCKPAVFEKRWEPKKGEPMPEDGKTTDSTFEGWAILELMGHRRLGGYVRQAEIAGAAFVRVDVPAPAESADEIAATQFYSPQAVYCLTPTTEEVARALAASERPAPVHRWELPAPVKADAVPADGADAE